MQTEILHAIFVKKWCFKGGNGIEDYSARSSPWFLSDFPGDSVTHLKAVSS